MTQLEQFAAIAVLADAILKLADTRKPQDAEKVIRFARLAKRLAETPHWELDALAASVSFRLDMSAAENELQK